MSLFTAICRNVNWPLPVRVWLVLSLSIWSALTSLVHARSCTSTSVWQLPVVRREMATGVRTTDLLTRPSRVCNHLVQIWRRVVEPSQVRQYWSAQMSPNPTYSIQAWVSQELYNVVSFTFSLQRYKFRRNRPSMRLALRDVFLMCWFHLTKRSHALVTKSQCAKIWSCYSY